MLIWGSKGKEIEVDRGQFFCPRCSRTRPYIHKKVSKYFTLYFIPLFETSVLGEYIECQYCRSPFRVEVLQYSANLQKNQRDKTELIIKITEELESGLSIQDLVSGIKSTGVEQEIIAAIIYEVTQGRYKACNQCGAFYISTLNNCSRCGSKLQPKTLLE